MVPQYAMPHPGKVFSAALFKSTGHIACCLVHSNTLGLLGAETDTMALMGMTFYSHYLVHCKAA